jgi:MFS family permease
LLQAGCFFGALAAAPLGDKLGRRIALALGAISFIVGSIMQFASAGSKPLMFVGRVLGGIVSCKTILSQFVQFPCDHD